MKQAEKQENNEEKLLFKPINQKYNKKNECKFRATKNIRERI